MTSPAALGFGPCATLAVVRLERTCTANYLIHFMNPVRRIRHLAISLGFVCGLLHATDNTAAPRGLEEGFAHPPPEARPWTLWQWMNGNVSKEGITADLEAFQKAGLGGAQSFHLDYGLPQGPVAFMSPEWLEMYLHAAQEAARLGIEIGTHNSGGWSTSGGPWTQPEHGMQVVTTTEARFRGPGKFSQVLPQPTSYLPPEQRNAYRDIAVLAYPTPANERTTLGAAAPKITVSTGKNASVPTLSGDTLQSFGLPTPTAKNASTLLLAFAEPFTARQLMLAPEKRGTGFDATLEVSDDGVTFRKVRSLQVAEQHHRQNYLYRQTFPFPEVTGRFFRLTVHKTRSAGRPLLLAEASLSGRETIENLPGKALYQRHYLAIKPQPAREDVQDGAIARGDIIDLTAHLDASGRLTWDAPAGDWTIVRIGHQPNGALNHPAPAGGEGLECDKLSREAVDAHWAGMLGRMIEKFGPLAGQSFTKVEIDSWEVGTQNWTPRFREEFLRRRGYDLLPFLPVFAGQIVENTTITERFLWDLRRTIADLFAENYAARLRELAHQHGLKLAVENYGTGPFDDLQYGGMADIPMGVHWMHNGSPQGCTLLAASAAHTYGHRIVGAEAFTAGELGGNRWDSDPYAFKRLGDLIFCSGVNKMIFHAGVLQRFPDLKPGLTFGKVGTQFSRTVTWWENAGTAWFRYLGRSQFLLQQGLPAADVLVLAGENAPSPTYGGSTFPAVPAGHDFDLCSTDAFLRRLSFRDGRFMMPDGMSYRVLLLPDNDTMTPPVLRKLKQLADAGATIVGPQPVCSPSYSGYPACDDEVRRLAAALWRPALDARGRGVSDQTVQTALDALGLKPDFEARGAKPQIAHKHRTTPDADIYFVSNQKYRAEEFEAVFRVTGKVPELWNPENGAIMRAPLYREQDGRTIVPLRLEDSGSVFVVFRAPSTHAHAISAKALPAPATPRQTLEILRAHYGSFDQKKQPRVADLTGTRAAGVKRIMTPERFVERDPAPGKPKHLLAQYLVDDVVHSQTVPADTVLELPQLPERFKLLRLLYGDLSAAPGPDDETVDVTATLRELVQDGTLNVTVDEKLAGVSPLPEVTRELRVEYRYNGRWNVAYLPDGQPLSLPGAYEAEAGPRTHELRAHGDSAIELLAWTPGRYEFATANGRTLAAQIDAIPASREITGPWRVTFPPKTGAPDEVTFDQLRSWTESADPGVKYFSGTATYIRNLEIPADAIGDHVALELNLGQVKNNAQVFLNGRDLGVLWKPPFRIDITDAVRLGANTLEIKVTNLWVNRLIGDEQLPLDREWNAKMNLVAWPQWLLDGKPSPTGRTTFATARHWTKDDAPLPSGLLGPVRLVPAAKRTLRAD